MGRYIIHLENRGFNESDAKDLLTRAKSIVSDALIRDARIAKKHIEFDLSVESNKIDSILQRLSSIAPLRRCTEIREREMNKDEMIEYARELFNEERYWECHEVLEGVWKESKGIEKEVIQGIILICAALVHAQKDEYSICLSILNRAIPKIHPIEMANIDLNKIRREAEGLKNKIEAKDGVIDHYFTI